MCKGQKLNEAHPSECGKDPPGVPFLTILDVKHESDRTPRIKTHLSIQIHQIKHVNAYNNLDFVQVHVPLRPVGKFLEGLDVTVCWVNGNNFRIDDKGGEFRVLVEEALDEREDVGVLNSPMRVRVFPFYRYRGHSPYQSYLQDSC